MTPAASGPSCKDIDPDYSFDVHINRLPFRNATRRQAHRIGPR